MEQLFDAIPAPYRDAAVVGIEVVIVLAVYALAWFLGRLLTKQIERRAEREQTRRFAQNFRRNLNLLLVVLLLCALGGLAALNAFLVYNGSGIYAETSLQLSTIPPDFWRALGLGLGKVAALVVAALLVIRITRRILDAIKQRAKRWGQVKANDESIEAAFESLGRIVKTGVWLAVLALASWWLLFPPAAPAFLWLALRVYLVIALGLLAVKAVAAIVDSLEALSAKFARGDRLLEIYERMRGLVPLLRRCLEYGIYVSVATLILAQLRPIADFAEYGPRLIQVIGIFFVARVAIEVCNLLVDRKFSKTDGLSELEQQQQATLSPLIKSFLRSLVFFGALVLMLAALKVNPWPLLAGAGLVGVIFGLGAQPVISDLVSGFFILSESQYLVGDFVEIGEARGRVESIQLRTTRIRGTDGRQHIFRNGQIATVVSHSKGYTFAVVDIGVSFDSNLDHVYQVLRDAGKGFASSEANVVAPPEVAGLEQFGASELLIRTVTRVKPGTHLPVARAWRKMIHEAFRDSGVEIPYPHQVNIRREAQPAASVPDAP